MDDAILRASVYAAAGADAILIHSRSLSQDEYVGTTLREKFGLNELASAFARPVGRIA
ncbi:hypothetical protein [Bradyrhizobium sp. B120]|uniref:hypothetical protein n=1 Tax=Bradyrhizobium sp. B120 TaxID=3410088 RepID=UPI003B97E748